MWMLLSCFLWPVFGALTGYAFAARDIGLIVFALILTVVLPVAAARTLKTGVITIKGLVVKGNEVWTWVLIVLLLAVFGFAAGVAYQLGDYAGAGRGMLLAWGFPLLGLGIIAGDVVGAVMYRRKWRKDYNQRKRGVPEDRSL
jgi:Mn2+/Fe2+ NRAMP family transporter